MFNVEMLSRLQFAFTISFHIIFPAFSIGLASFLVVMERLWLKTNNIIYYQIIRFWTKVFALTFGMGVVAGIVMEFQLGTNWAGFSRQVGSVLGPLFIYEVLSAFFLEAGFIGVMIFGWDKVGKRLHYMATIMVTLGTTISAYWIMAANSWMQHPVGYQIINGKYAAISWRQIIFNTYTLTRFTHMVLGAYIAASCVIISVSAYYLLRNQFTDFAKKCLGSAIIVITIIMPLQIFIGDLSGVHVYEHQPLKTAAIEGVWNTTKGAPLLLFALPSNTEQRNLFEIGIPYAASLINTHKFDGELIGLASVVPEDQPEAWIVFFSFRIMLAIGLFLLVYALYAAFLMFKKRLYLNQKILFISQFLAPLGFIAILTGWFTAEVGRQPWAVYGLIRTTDAASHVSIYNVLVSFILIIIVYGVIFGYFYFYFLDKTIKNGPTDLSLIQPFGFLSNEEIRGDDR